MSVLKKGIANEPEIPAFITKTYQILFCQEFSKIIFWSPTGTHFIIKDPNKFQEIVLPRFFRHKKINSFVRQLNMYGFHKSRKENSKSIFYHPSFLKSRHDLLNTIKRQTKNKHLNQPIDETLNLPQNSPTFTPLKKEETEGCDPSIVSFIDNEKVQKVDLNVSLGKISQDQFGQLGKFQEDSEVSLGKNLEVEEHLKWHEGLLNPSCFFSSFSDKQ